MEKILLAATSLLALAGAAAAQDSFGNQPPPVQQQQQPSPQQQGQYPQQQYPQQQYPQQPGYPQQQQPQWGGQQQGGANLDQLAQMERQDFGVQPTAQLHSGAMHGPTPASVPGGQVITTKGIVELVQGRQTPFIVLDVLGGPELLPGAMYAVPAHQAGGFSDQTQQEFGGFLQQMTGGNKEIPLILYCQSNQCWMSYNAALRAINLGYKNVLWYRGGIEAWKIAGQPVTTPQQQQQMQQQLQQQTPRQPQ
jgi:rhodanese-related sulfurtransferase